MTKVVTFYSYKGGVGRTMALVNVAHVLARDGWRVLMVDFDLEAPGMTHFFSNAVRQKSSRTSRDALDLLLDAKRTLPDASSQQRPEFVTLEPYVIPIELPEECRNKSIPYLSGRLDLIPATLTPQITDGELTPGRDYLQRMDELDLAGVFSPSGPRHQYGDHVRKYFVASRFDTPGDILFTMREMVKGAYDIVLVDSRTGFNEISGLCIGPLCDSLVICTGLNRQNIEGTRYFMECAGLLEPVKAKPYVVVAGPEPPWHTREAKNKFSLIRGKLKAKRLVRIPYHPRAALEETVFVLKEPHEPITRAYEELAPLLIEQIDDDRHWLSRKIRDDDSSRARPSRTVAGHLASLRARPSSMRYPGVLRLLPSACTMCGIPCPSHRLTPNDLEPLVLAAAVSAYRLRDPHVFDRARKLAALFEEPYSVDFQMRLLFMQLRVLGSIPNDPDTRALFHKAIHDTLEERNSDVYLGPAGPVSVPFDTAVTSLYMSGFDTPLTRTLRREEVEKRVHEFGARLQLFRDHTLYWLSEWDDQFSSKDLEACWDAFFALLRSPPRQLDRKPLQRLLQLPNQKPQEYRGPSGDFFVPVSGMRFRISAREREYVTPLGYWPIAIIVSAVASIKGTDSIDEVLEWMRIARVEYGYAWRVMVDWRHLAPVRNHPKFVKFLRKEDEMVDAIETDIDRGVYPL